MFARLLLLLLCVLLLPACGEPVAEPVGSEPTGTTFQVACLNVWAVPLAARDLDLRFGRLLPALRTLAPDVVCLQEVFLESTRRRIVDGLGDDYAFTPGTAGGLLIASRFGVESSAFAPYPEDGRLRLAERLARKGFLEAVLPTPAGRLRVVTTHLAAEFSEDGARKAQQDVLLEHLATRTDLPLLLAGDLNTLVVRANGPTPTWRAFEGLGFVHAEPPRRAEGGGWRTATPTRVGWPRDGRLGSWAPDHVLVRGSGAVDATFLAYAVTLDTLETAVSDHNLLLATVRLVPR